MIKKMESRGPSDWCVYMLRCTDGSLYTGVAKDVQARYKQHETGKGAAYTRTHPPVALVYHQSDFTRSEALIREAALKRLSKQRKEDLLKNEIKEPHNGNGKRTKKHRM